MALVDLKDKVALITGAGSGICLELTKRLVSKGAKVLIVDLQLTPGAEELVKSNQAAVKFQKADVTKWDELEKSFATVIAEFGKLDIVVPGAGIFEPPSSNFWQFNTSGTADTRASSSFKIFDINVNHPVRATQLAIDSYLRQKQGHGVVVLISSIAAQLGLLPIPLYCASKHAISGFARSLGHLEDGINIRINCVAPGCVDTPIWPSERRTWLKDGEDVWVKPSQVVDTMIDLITKPEHRGGTVLEVGADKVRDVQELNDPGPQGPGHTVAGVGEGYANVYQIIGQNYGK